MAFGRQKQTLQVAPKFFTLATLLEQDIKVLGVGFQRFRSWGNSNSLRHLTLLLSPILSHPLPCQQTTGRKGTVNFLLDFPINVGSLSPSVPPVVFFLRRSITKYPDSLIRIV